MVLDQFSCKIKWVQKKLRQFCNCLLLDDPENITWAHGWPIKEQMEKSSEGGLGVDMRWQKIQTTVLEISRINEEGWLTQRAVSKARDGL